MKPIKQELPDRRKFLYGLGSSIGAIAFSNLLAAENTLTSLDVPKLQPQPMLTAKAKSCIFLTMEGGPSHIDTFDPKSKLTELHLKTSGAAPGVSSFDRAVSFQKSSIDHSFG